MSLTTRVSAFFLGLLALVLVGFSLTLYQLAHTYLYRQFDARLHSALETLVAAAEIKPDGVDWEPEERHFDLGRATGDEIRWIVRDGDGKVVDRSRNWDLEQAWLTTIQDERITDAVTAEGSGWRFWQRRLATAEGRFVAEEKKHEVLILTAALDRGPVYAALRSLALSLATLTLFLWIFAALLGRWICRRALAPVTRMAAAARAMTVSDLEQRLPAPQTGDELADLGSAFNDLLARLQEALERQRRFTGDASHQLRTPLTALLGQIEVALKRERPVEEYRQVLERAQGQGMHLRQIVEMLLFLARADAESQQAQLETLDLTDWLHEHLQRWSEHPRAGDLVVEGADAACWVRAQGPLLGQLLDNLLENACKYSDPGTSITIRLEREAGQIVCSVSDQGCGIAPEDLPHIYEPFYRSARARRQGHQGVGLGLAVAQRIASALNATLSVDSVLGGGSRFTLRFSEAARA